MCAWGGVMELETAEEGEGGGEVGEEVWCEGAEGGGVEVGWVGHLWGRMNFSMYVGWGTFEGV